MDWETFLFEYFAYGRVIKAAKCVMSKMVNRSNSVAVIKTNQGKF